MNKKQLCYNNHNESDDVKMFTTNKQKMKKIIRLAAILILFICFISMNVKEKDFHVRIEQNGKVFESINGLVTLDKKEFNIVFEFSEPMGLLINGSFYEKTYKLASKGIIKSELPGFKNTGMAEGLLNPDKEILISDDSPNYWFYDDNEKNRFNSIEEAGGNILCRRIIQNLYDVETKTTIKVEDVSKPLYLVFISYKRGEKITDEIELKREWIKIIWNK